MEVNKLILGDNLEILKTLEPESVDLIYLDPPFFSDRNYEVIWGDEGEVRSFQDRWSGGRDHDTIFVYAKSEEFKIHPDKNDYPPSESTLKRWAKYADENGFVSNKHFARSSSTIINTQDKTKGFNINSGIPRDVWDIQHLAGNNPQKIGYPTQKLEDLLERILKCASNEGDIVLDPFVGGGTTVAVADRLNRKWIGIDQSVQAVKVTELRLNKQTDLFTSIYANSYTLQLHKYDYDTLRNMDAFEFENWIIGQYGAMAHNRKGGDKGMDGKSSDGAPIQVKR